jgi:hypothetical protein
MGSYESINYLLRPSKQIERKIFIETLLRLSKLDYHINEYTYLGMGSIHYADFILFHKHLMIDKLICVEEDEIPNRMEFNKPYDFIKLYCPKSISEYISCLDENELHFVWLDYDSYLTENELSDIRSLIHKLKPGSILTITIQADPKNLSKLVDQTEWNNLSLQDKGRIKLERVKELIGKYLSDEIKQVDLGFNNLPKLYSKALLNYIKSFVSKRQNLSFYPLFNFKYCDGVQMITIGGIIDVTDLEEKINKLLPEITFVPVGEKPLEISVPPLTIKEKHWLEKNVVKNDAPPEVAFELGEEFTKNFNMFYKQYPIYNELLF